MGGACDTRRGKEVRVEGLKERDHSGAIGVYGKICVVNGG